LKIACAIAGFIFCCITLPGLCGEEVQMTGIFTNMRYNAESGDLTGIELFITRSDDGYHVQFQATANGALSPVLVSAEVNPPYVEFVLPKTPHSYSGRFKGKFTARGLQGQFEGGQLVDGKKDFLLKRTKSYWQ
jgi:hypothetical protein